MPLTEDLMDANPQSLREAVDLLYDALDEEELEFFDQNDDATAKSHFGGGMALRNGWGLWYDSDLANWFADRGIHHADDMSGIILDKLQAKVCGEEFDLDARIDHYQRYWEENGRSLEDMHRQRELRIKDMQVRKMRGVLEKIRDVETQNYNHDEMLYKAQKWAGDVLEELFGEDPS